MKLLQKLSAVAVSALMMFGTAGINTFATSTMQDGLEVSFATDKETYTKDEKITATLSVKNTNESDVTDILMETVIPNGYEIADGTKDIKQIDKLTPNETAELKVMYVTQSKGEVSKNSQVNKEENEKDQVSRVSSSDDTISTGDTTVQLAVLIPIVVCSLTLIIWGMRKKKIKVLFSITISISVMGSVMAFFPLDVDAVRENQKIVSISQAVKVDNRDFTIKANVTYTYAKAEVSQVSETSEMSAGEAYEYYNENANIISVIKSKESSNVLSERDVAKLLSDRGFFTDNIVTDYTMDGEYLNEIEIEDNSTEKHPLYKMLYGSKMEILWNIYVINGVVSAYPVSYNLVSDRQAVLLITETDTVTSYDYISNQFYETIPKESAMIVRKVSKIDKETLDNFTIGGLNEL